MNNWTVQDEIIIHFLKEQIKKYTDFIDLCQKLYPSTELEYAKGSLDAYTTVLKRLMYYPVCDPNGTVAVKYEKEGKVNE